MSIRKDMRRVEKLFMPQPANRAALSIRLNHSRSEALLMQAALRGDGGVGPFDLRIGRDPCVICYADASSVADFNSEAERSRIISYDVDGPNRRVRPRYDAIKVDQRNLSLHASP